MGKDISPIPRYFRLCHPARLQLVPYPYPPWHEICKRGWEGMGDFLGKEPAKVMHDMEITVKTGRVVTIAYQTLNEEEIAGTWANLISKQRRTHENAKNLLGKPFTKLLPGWVPLTGQPTCLPPMSFQFATIQPSRCKAEVLKLFLPPGCSPPFISVLTYSLLKLIYVNGCGPFRQRATDSS